MIKKITLLTAMLLLPITAFASVTTNNVNIPIQESSDSSRVIYVVPNNVLLEKSGAVGGYYQVNYNGVSGFVNKQYTVEGEKESTTFVQIAAQRKKYFRDNNYKYGYGSICPADYTRSRQVDCSGFVSDVIYHYGKQTDNKKLMSIGRKTSSYFNSIGKSLSKGKENANFTLVSISDIKAGDILCYAGHVEIYAGKKSSSGRFKVYNCGSTKAITSSSLITTASNSKSKITYILRVK